MRINKQDFVDFIDDKFWTEITARSKFDDTIKFEDLKRKVFLQSLAIDLLKNEHSFKAPDYFFYSKKFGILRAVRVYNLKDICIYYYCVKKIQGELFEATKENSNIFGAVQFAVKPKQLKENKVGDNNNEENLILYNPEYNLKLSKDEYKKDWKEYQHLAEQVKASFDFYVHIDIAHFYDDINLDILEGRVREKTDGKSEIVNLLFYFLQYSDKKDLGYLPSSVGIPQTEIGEMSSLIANFYLSEYDLAFNQSLTRIFGEKDDFLYFRYSDDMWICFNGSKNLSLQIIQNASFNLSRIKLHINEAKILILDSEQYQKYWRFDDWDNIFQLIEDKEYYKILKVYKEIILEISHPEGNSRSRNISIGKYLLKYITSCNDLGYTFLVRRLVQRNGEFTMFILHSIFDNPTLSEGLEYRNKSFIARLVRQSPIGKKFLKGYLSGIKNIYPNLEYLSLELLSMDVLRGDYILWAQRYIKFKEDYQWYSRCICLKVLSSNIRKIKLEMSNSSDPTFYRQSQLKLAVDEVVANIKSSEPYQNLRERRYSVYFLYYLNSSEANKVLSYNFTQQDDLSVMRYLKENGI